MPGTRLMPWLVISGPDMSAPRSRTPFFYAMASAALFGVSTPLAKILVQDISPLALAGLLYLGAFVGLSFYIVLSRTTRGARRQKAPSLKKEDLPWLAGAIITGGIFAPVALMTGLTLVTGFAASLLSNLEGVATAIIAVVVFKEFAGRRLWLALTLMTLAGVFLVWNPSQGAFELFGPLLVVFAMVCWGIDNNLTQHISSKDPVQTALLKGVVAGTVSLSLAALLGAKIPLDASILYALLLGAMSYGMSLAFFIKALEGIGSSRTAAFFSFGPFVGAIVSIPLLGENVTWAFLAAAALMLVGVLAMVSERHVHTHRHGAIEHEHLHESDQHHQHPHPEGQNEPHSHIHVHPPIVHSHVHWPDQHHRHGH